MEVLFTSHLKNFLGNKNDKYMYVHTARNAKLTSTQQDCEKTENKTDEKVFNHCKKAFKETNQSLYSDASMKSEIYVLNFSSKSLENS